MCQIVRDSILLAGGHLDGYNTAKVFASIESIVTDDWSDQRVSSADRARQGWPTNNAQHGGRKVALSIKQFDSIEQTQNYFVESFN